MKTLISILLAISLMVVSFSVFAVPVNINTADTELIADSLTGIGMKTAQKIVDYREKHGAFKSVEELLNVSGIGEKKLAKIREDIKLTDSDNAKKVQKK